MNWSFFRVLRLQGFCRREPPSVPVNLFFEVEFAQRVGVTSSSDGDLAANVRATLRPGSDKIFKFETHSL